MAREEIRCQKDHNGFTKNVEAGIESCATKAQKKVSATLLEVIAYCDRGWAVHPLNNKKRPLFEGWQNKATTNPDIFMQWLQEWPCANVGIITGSVSNLLILDVDGAEGIVSLKDLDLPESPTVVTARGHHYYFNFPSSLSTVSTTRAGLFPGIDTRGRGGYITAPPSVHETGHKYYWSKPLDGELPDAPMWLIQRLTPPKRLADKIPVYHGEINQRYIQTALRNEATEVEMALAGTRNARLNQAAFSMGTLVAHGSIDVEYVARILAQAAINAGLCRSEIEKTLCSGLSAGMQHPREVFRG